MMGKILGAWRIISVIEIYNRRPDIQRLRRIGSRDFGRTSVWREPLDGAWDQEDHHSRGSLAAAIISPEISAETAPKII